MKLMIIKFFVTGGILLKIERRDPIMIIECNLFVYYTKVQKLSQKLTDS